MKKTLQPHQGKLKEITFDDDANMWDFKWTGEVRLLTGVFWRLFRNDKVQTISLDHNKV